MHSTNTTAGTRRLVREWRPRPLACASALFVCLSVSACSVDYELGTLDGPATLPSGIPLGIVATDGERLYALDESTMQFAPGRPLVGCDLPIVELTRRERGELFAAGWAKGVGALYRVRESGECTRTARFAMASSWALAFVPEAAGGRLIGDEGGRLVALDVLGAQTEILKRPILGQVTGDIVVGADGEAWVSAESALGDVMLERIDPRSGALRQSFTVASHDPIEGLAFASADLVGFTRGGKVVRLKVNGAGVDVVPISVVGAPVTFTGAASAESASAPR